MSTKTMSVCDTCGAAVEDHILEESWIRLPNGINSFYVKNPKKKHSSFNKV